MVVMMMMMMMMMMIAFCFLVHLMLSQPEYRGININNEL